MVPERVSLSGHLVLERISRFVLIDRIHFLLSQNFLEKFSREFVN